uniref:FBA_2 domain-containing protein n=1 Tax=Caenorhabditis tropicalis TaxID=1561998 RepID=A0A1I7TQ53_9PELO
MSTTFRLFDVTDVVFDEILIQLELNEIFNLSLCSLKTLNIIRRHMRKSIKYPLFVDTKDNYEMSFGFIRNGEGVIMMSVREYRMYDGRQFEKVNLGGKKTQISRYDDHIAFFGSSRDETMDGFILVMDQIAHLFREGITTLYCDSPWSMRFLPLQNGYIPMTYAGSEKCQKEFKLVDYEMILAHKTRGLHLRSPLPEGYDFTLTREYLYFRVERAPNARLNDVLKLAKGSKQVIFDQSRLISKDLNTFFNLWLKKRIDGLQLLSIRMKSYREITSFKRINNKISDSTMWLSYLSYTGKTYRLSPGKCLQRDDGVTAYFYYNPNTKILNFGDPFSGYMD